MTATVLFSNNFMKNFKSHLFIYYNLQQCELGIHVVVLGIKNKRQSKVFGAYLIFGV